MASRSRLGLAARQAVNGVGGSHVVRRWIREAITQRLAEAYIKEIPAIAKQARMIVVPDKPNDVAGVVATAMAIAGEVPQLSAAAPAGK